MQYQLRHLLLAILSNWKNIWMHQNLLLGSLAYHKRSCQKNSSKIGSDKIKYISRFITWIFGSICSCGSELEVARFSKNRICESGIRILDSMELVIEPSLAVARLPLKTGITNRDSWGIEPTLLRTKLHAQHIVKHSFQVSGVHGYSK